MGSNRTYKIVGTANKRELKLVGQVSAAKMVISKHGIIVNALCLVFAVYSIIITILWLQGKSVYSEVAAVPFKMQSINEEEKVKQSTEVNTIAIDKTILDMPIKVGNKVVSNVPEGYVEMQGIYVKLQSDCKYLEESNTYYSEDMSIRFGGNGVYYENLKEYQRMHELAGVPSIVSQNSTSTKVGDKYITVERLEIHIDSKSLHCMNLLMGDGEISIISEEIICDNDLLSMLMVPLRNGMNSYIIGGEETTKGITVCGFQIPVLENTVITETAVCTEIVDSDIKVFAGNVSSFEDSTSMISRVTNELSENAVVEISAVEATWSNLNSKYYKYSKGSIQISSYVFENSITEEYACFFIVNSDSKYNDSSQYLNVIAKEIMLWRTL